MAEGDTNYRVHKSREPGCQGQRGRGEGRGGEGGWEETEGGIIGRKKEEQRRGKWKNYVNYPGTEKEGEKKKRGIS